jgi:uncharacterized protein YjdB
VATVDENGNVTGISAGTTGITATAEDGGFNYTCIVTVQSTEISVTGITLDKATLTVPVSDTKQLTASVAPSNATDKSVVWSSNNTEVATVDNNGVVTGVSAGTAVITATAADGNFNSSCVVTVQDSIVPATGISLDRATFTLKMPNTIELIATVTPANATNKNVSWTSSVPAVATVNNGVVTGVAAGVTTITATSDDGSYIAQCEITVEIPVTGVSLNKTTLSLYIDDVETLAATVTPANATNKNVSWTSSVPAIATVDDDGIVAGVSTGTATITATAEDGGFAGSCTVTVTKGNVASTGWSAPSANGYEYSMTYVARVTFRGVLSANADVEIAAYVGNELRGHAKLVYEPELKVSLIHLTVFSNNAGGEKVTLKAFNPDTQRIYNNCKEFTFQENASLGSTSEILNCLP